MPSIPNIDIYNLPIPQSIELIGSMSDLLLYNNGLSQVISVEVEISCNYIQLLTERYNVLPLNHVNIKLSDVLKHAFKFHSPCLSLQNGTLQNNANMIDVTLSFKSGDRVVSSSFFVINNRLSVLDSSEVVSKYFFTTQPKVKRVSKQDIEILTCFSMNNRKLMSRASRSNQIEDVLFAELGAGLVDVTIDFSKLNELFSLNHIESYSFFYENAEESCKTFVINQFTGQPVRMFYFENSAGGVSSITAYGESTTKNKYKSLILQSDDSTADYLIDNTKSVIANSGYLSSSAEQYFFKDFLGSMNKYELYNNTLRRITLKEATADSAIGVVANYKFEYQYTDNNIDLPTSLLPFKKSNDQPLWITPSSIITSTEPTDVMLMIGNDSCVISDKYTWILSDLIAPYVIVNINPLNQRKLTISQTGIAISERRCGFLIIKNSTTRKSASLMITIQPTSIGLSETNKIVSFRNGSESLRLTSADNWTSHSDSEWLNVVPDSGVGNTPQGEELSITFSANSGDILRTGVIKFSSIGMPAFLTVSQKGKLSDVTQWNQLPQLPEGQFNGTAATIGNNMYIIGGNSIDCYMFSLASMTYTMMPSLPVAVKNLSQNSPDKNNKIYVFGGSRSDTGVGYDYMQIFNALTNTWSSSSKCSNVGNTHGASVATLRDNDNIYCINGNNSHYNKKYNVLINTWTDATKSPIPLYNAMAIALGGAIYLVGGGDARNWIPSTATLKYTLASDTWTTLPTLNTRRHDLVGATAFINGAERLVITGGRLADDSVTNVTEYFNGLEWVNIPSLNFPNLTGGIMSVTSYNGHIVCFGGWSNLGGVDFGYRHAYVLE